MFHVPSDAESLVVAPLLRTRRAVGPRQYLVSVRPAPGAETVRDLADGAYAWSDGMQSPYRYVPAMDADETTALRSFPVPKGWSRFAVTIHPWRGATASVEDAFEPLILQATAEVPGTGSTRCWLVDDGEEARA